MNEMMQELIPLAQVFSLRPGRLKLLQQGLETIRWQSGDRLLEIGCGTGEASAYLANTINAEVVGVDADSEMIEIARKKFGHIEGCSFQCCDAKSLPFESTSFDGAYMEAVFSGATDKRAIIKEIARLLKSGTKLLVNDFVYKNSQRNRNSGIPCMEGAQTAEYYRSLIEGLGFRIVLYREKFYDYAAIVNTLCKEYQCSSGEVGVYISRHFGSARTVEKQLETGGRMSYCQMIFEKI